MIQPDQHVVLVGLMGVGKSTVARVLGERLGRPVLDTDAMIEARTGRAVRSIFADDGEDVFRDIEVAVLAEALAATRPSVIAAAGGVVLRAENRAVLGHANARVVWLCADPTLLLERVRGGAHRPALDHDPAGTLRHMRETREPLYREVADIIVSIDGRSVADVVDAVLR